MFTNNTQVLRRAICAGCLSQDRKLSAVRDLKTYAFFCYALALDEKDWVCWECKLMVKKLAIFRKQVTESQESLSDLLGGRPCQIKSSSNLTSVTITDEPEEAEDETFVEVESLDPLFYQLVDETPQSEGEAEDNAEGEAEDDAEGEAEGDIESLDDDVDNDGGAESRAVDNEANDDNTNDSVDNNEEMNVDEAEASKETVDDAEDGQLTGDDVMRVVKITNESVREDATASNKVTGDFEETLDDEINRGEEVASDVREVDDADDAIGEETIVEEVTLEDDTEQTIQVTYIDQTAKAVASIIPMPQIRFVDKINLSNAKDVYVTMATAGSSKFTDVTTSAVSTVRLSLDENEIQLPRTKPSILKNATTSLPSKSQDDITNIHDTSEEIEDPFSVHVMSQDEMCLWRTSKIYKEFYTNCPVVWRCEDCVEPFENQRMFTAHMKSHTKAYGDIACEICQLRFHDDEELTTHKKKHYRLLMCKRCEFQWDSPNGMRAHCLQVHGLPVAAWLCDHCDREYKELSKMQHHRSSHQARKCPECGVLLRSNVYKHIRRAHKNLPLMTCAKCGLKCRGQKSLQDHIKRCRTVDEQTYCVKCDRHFANKLKLRAHYKSSVKHITDDDLRFQCSSCGKGFKDSASLMHHIDSVHEKVKKYLCEICGKGFYTMVSRKKHEARVHRERPVVKKHVCAQCGKAYERKARLEEHMNTHTGVRPFVCNCGATFTGLNSLRTHIRLKHVLPNSGQTKAQKALAAKGEEKKKKAALSVGSRVTKEKPKQKKIKVVRIVRYD